MEATLVETSDKHRKITQFLRMSHRQINCWLAVKGMERGQDERQLSVIQNCTARKQRVENTWKRKDDSRGRAVRSESGIRNHRGIFLGLETYCFSQLDFEIASETSFFLSIFSLF